MTRGIQNIWEHSVCENLPACPGIYIIWFEGVRRAYIGQSNNMYRRVLTHLYEMQAYHDHKMLGDFKTMGRELLRAMPLEVMSDTSELSEKESYWIATYRRHGWDLYNRELKGKPHRDRIREQGR